VGATLYAATVAQARTPALYAALGAPDTPDGRFEVYTLHVLLVLTRLRAIGAPAAPAAQAYFDAYLGGLDNGLRELAVGDLSVGKTMRRLGEAFYGRGKALDAAVRRPAGPRVAGWPARPAPSSAARRASPRRRSATTCSGPRRAGRRPAETLLAGEIPWPALG
jgi:cytochrome b pre-mRNA-processing protein 3